MPSDLFLSSTRENERILGKTGEFEGTRENWLLWYSEVPFAVLNLL